MTQFLECPPPLLISRWGGGGGPTIVFHSREHRVGSRLFPTGQGWGVHPPVKNLLIQPPLTKIPPTKFLSPPTKQQFSHYNTIKTAFLAVVIAPAPFLVLISYSLDTQVMLILILIDV